MTRALCSSFIMPISDASGLLRGGKYWVSDDLYVNNPKTWNGIVIDSSGILLGTTVNERQSHKGITVWKKDLSEQYNSKKRLQITEDGIGIYGGGSIWGPENFVNTDYTTYLGVVINNLGITAYNGSSAANIPALPTVQIKTNGDFVLGKTTGNQLTYTESTGLFTVPAILTSMLGVATAPGNGLLLQNTGLSCYRNSIKTFELLTDGSLTIGVTGSQLTYTASNGLFTVPAIYTSILAVGNITSFTGMLFDSTGLVCLTAGSQTSKIYTNGNFQFGYVANKQLTFTASTGVLDIGSEVLVTQGTTPGTVGYISTGGSRAYLGLSSAGRATLALSTDTITDAATIANGVVLDTAGLRSYKSSAVTLNIEDTGSFTFGTNATNKLAYSVATGNLTFGALDGSNNGVVINQAGLKGYKSNTLMFDLKTDGSLTIGRATGNQLLVDSNNGYLVIGSLTSGTGLVLSQIGLQAYKNSVKTVDITIGGDFTLGSTVGNQLIYSGNLLTLPALYTYILAVGNSTNVTGMVLDNTGLGFYTAGVQSSKIYTNGNFQFGYVANKTISFTASTGALSLGSEILVTQGTTANTVGRVATGGSRAYLGLNSSGNAILSIGTHTITENYGVVTNGVVLDMYGLRGYKAGVQNFGIDTSGNAFFKGDLTSATVSTTGITFSGSSSGQGINFATGGQIYGGANTLNLVGNNQIVLQSLIGMTFSTGVIYLNSTYVNIGGSWSDATLDVNNRAGGTIAATSIKVRHIDGKISHETGYDTLYLQYGAAGYGVLIGDNGTDHPLTVYGTVTAPSFVGSLTGSCSGSSGSCTGNAATASVAGTAYACSGNAVTSSSCSGNAATASVAVTSYACSGNAATSTSTLRLTSVTYPSYYLTHDWDGSGWNIAASNGSYVRVARADTLAGISHTSSSVASTVMSRDSSNNTAVGNIYVGNLCYTDTISFRIAVQHSTYPKDLQTAKEALLSIRRADDYDETNHKKQLNHNKLHSYIKEVIKHNDLKPDEIGQNIGATIGCLVECVKYLLEKDKQGNK